MNEELTRGSFIDSRSQNMQDGCSLYLIGSHEGSIQEGSQKSSEITRSDGDCRSHGQKRRSEENNCILLLDRTFRLEIHRDNVSESLIDMNKEGKVRKRTARGWKGRSMEASLACSSSSGTRLPSYNAELNATDNVVCRLRQNRRVRYWKETKRKKKNDLRNINFLNNTRNNFTHIRQ